MRLLLTGDYEHAEFSAAVAAMRSACEVMEQASLERAAQWLETEGLVDLIVVAQSRPGQFAAAELERLRRAAPLAPLVALVGSWCEGEPRSGAPWPGAVRVYWHQWSVRFPREIARLARGEAGDWSQPPTATPEERLLAKSGSAGKTLRGVTAVVSGSVEMADWLSAACREVGLESVVFHVPPSGPVAGVRAVLWDAGLARPDLIDDCRRLAASFFAARIVVLVDFPRDADVRRLSEAGAALVLAKPIPIADLRRCLGCIVSP